MQAEAGLRFVLERAKLKVKSHVFKTGTNPATTVDDLFVSVFVTMYI